MLKKIFLMFVLSAVFAQAYTAALPVPTETSCVHRDAGFSGDGLFLFKNSPENQSVGYGMAADDTGRFVISGVYGHPLDMLILRLNPDGTPDTSFNSTGYVTHNISMDDYGYDVTIKDSKIIVCGTSNYAIDEQENVTIWRFLDDGTPDYTFNSAGYAVLAEGAAHCVATDNNNKIVIGGTGGIWRLNNNGSLDSSFNSTGFVELDGLVNDITTAPDNKITAVGRSSSMIMTAWRLNSDGSFDTSFNGTGFITYDFPGGSKDYDSGHSLVIGQNGRLVIAGLTDSRPAAGNFPYSMVLWRYNTDGTLDTSFNGTGFTINNNSTGDMGRCGPVVISAGDGSYLVTAAGAGFGAAQDMSIWKYDNNGEIDLSFNNTGVITYDTGYDGVYGDDPRAGILIDPLGRIVTAGSIENPYLDLAVWVYIDECPVSAHSATPTPTVTPSFTETLLISPSTTTSATATDTVTPGISEAYTYTPAFSLTPALTPTTSPWNPSSTATYTPTPGASSTPVLTFTPAPALSSSTTTPTSTPTAPAKTPSGITDKIVTVGKNVLTGSNKNALIKVDMRHKGHIEIFIFSRSGRLIRTLKDKQVQKGIYAFKWRGDDDSGQIVTSGIYYLYVCAGGIKRTEKIAVVR